MNQTVSKKVPGCIFNLDKQKECEYSNTLLLYSDLIVTIIYLITIIIKFI